jgi:hypothetical protein
MQPLKLKSSMAWTMGDFCRRTEPLQGVNNSRDGGQSRWAFKQDLAAELQIAGFHSNLLEAPKKQGTCLMGT